MMFINYMRLKKWVICSVIAIIFAACKEQPTYNNPYDPKINPAPYKVIGKVYLTLNTNESFNIGGYQFAVIIPSELKNVELAGIESLGNTGRSPSFNQKGDTLLVNWVDVGHPVNINKDQKLVCKIIYPNQLQETLKHNFNVVMDRTDFYTPDGEPISEIKSVEVKTEIK